MMLPMPRILSFIRPKYSSAGATAGFAEAACANAATRIAQTKNVFARTFVSLNPAMLERADGSAATPSFANIIEKHRMPNRVSPVTVRVACAQLIAREIDAAE